MKPFRISLVITAMATAAYAPLFGQLFEPQPPQPPQEAQLAREQAERARETLQRVRELEDRVREYYNAGARAIDERDYEKAIKYYERVIERKAARMDGSMYWKAYSLYKLGKRDDALSTLAELEKQYAQSRWLNDARALALEVRQASGQGPSPESQTDEELKLLAINSLMSSDPERATPLLEKLLGESKNPPSLKKRALFVLAQSRSQKAREIVASYAKGGSNPDLQIQAIEYLGTFRGKDNTQLLADVYSAVSDVGVKRSILRAYMMGQDKERLFAAAKGESNAELRRDAIHWLGTMQAQAELAQLYSSEGSAELKETILQSLFVGQATDKLIEIAKNEKDTKLRRTAISRLGMMRRAATADALAALYAAESDKTIKTEIIHALSMQQSAKGLVDLARKETDSGLKREIVHRLSMIKSKEATDYLMELLNK